MDSMIAIWNELVVALESIKAQFPEVPIVEPGERDGSLRWAPLEQVARNLIFKGPDWSMLHSRARRAPVEYRQDIRISLAAK